MNRQLERAKTSVSTTEGVMFVRQRLMERAHIRHAKMHGLILPAEELYSDPAKRVMDSQGRNARKNEKCPGGDTLLCQL